jgi:signal transduction histidine kinase
MTRIVPPTRRPWGLVAVGLAAGLPCLTLAVIAERALAARHAARLEALRAPPTEGAATVRGRLAVERARLLERVDTTPVDLWAERVLDVDGSTRPSPLIASFDGLPVLAWFGEDALDVRARGEGTPPTNFLALADGAPAAVSEAIEAVVAAWSPYVDEDRLAAWVARLPGPTRVEELPLAALLWFVVQSERRPDRFEATAPAAETLLEVSNQDHVDVVLGAPTVTAAGDGLVVVAREVAPTASEFELVPSGVTAPRQALELAKELPRHATLLQGVVLDRAALLDRWLDRARATLPEGVLLGRTLPDLGPDAPRASVDLDAALGLRRGPGRDLRTAVLAVDPRPLLWRQRLEWWGLQVLLLTLTAAGGWWLVSTLRRIQRQQRRAERIGNFVAAVTHEFRTPLSTIALHAEMLLDGWAEDPDQRREYHRRIANETSRLSRLVERILEQSQLTRGRAQAPPTEPHLDDLSRVVEELRPSIEAGAPAGPLDVAFELADDLPPVRLTNEALESIVTNLVENARKYAPVGPGGEPILVRTLRGPDGVRLEVLDRGPGIPESERRRVFEAFYRLGNETTRTTTGTGLGLHLVELQAKSLGGRVEATDRPGGGSCMRVVLPAGG